MTKKQNNAYHRLPVTFHQTFIPERAHISALLKFAASGNESTSTPLSVTDQEISVETGIPTGQSSGKVPAMLDYCRGMGLIQLERGTYPEQKRPVPERSSAKTGWVSASWQAAATRQHRSPTPRPTAELPGQAQTTSTQIRQRLWPMSKNRQFPPQPRSG